MPEVIFFDPRTDSRSLPHGTRARPGSATYCASRASPTCGGGRAGRGVVRLSAAHPTRTPTPDPSPQGGGEQDSAPVKLAVRRLVLAVASLLFVTPALADTIYVSNEQDNTISVIDSASLSVTATV